VVTYALIAINVLFFFVELSAGDAFIERWSVVPQRLLANPVGDFITVFTAMFMHGGWMHLLSNMLYLWIFGDNVEDRLGHTKFIIFYLLCGIAATFAQVLVNPNSTIPNLGASGAIAGVLGAYLLMFPRGSVRVLMGRAIIPMPALIVIGFWALLQIVSGIGSIATTAQTADTGGVAYMAHVGGFVAGLILAPLMGGTRQQARLRAG
jgi:membrane associated rhomboid family serine protease